LFRHQVDALCLAHQDVEFAGAFLVLEDLVIVMFLNAGMEYCLGVCYLIRISWHVGPYWLFLRLSWNASKVQVVCYVLFSSSLN
jgi:hypothetical protein